MVAVCSWVTADCWAVQPAQWRLRQSVRDAFARFFPSVSSMAHSPHAAARALEGRSSTQFVPLARPLAQAQVIRAIEASHEGADQEATRLRARIPAGHLRGQVADERGEWGCASGFKPKHRDSRCRKYRSDSAPVPSHDHGRVVQRSLLSRNQTS